MAGKVRAVVWRKDIGTEFAEVELGQADGTSRLLAPLTDVMLWFLL